MWHYGRIGHRQSCGKIVELRHDLSGVGAVLLSGWIPLCRWLLSFDGPKRDTRVESDQAVFGCFGTKIRELGKSGHKQQ